MAGLDEIAIETGPGVFHCRSWGLTLSHEVVNLLIDEARANVRRRARLCLHPSQDDVEQQMLIVLVDGATDPAHKHPDKREALLPILGQASYQTFDDVGHLSSETRLSAGESIYVSSPVGVFHRLVLRGPIFAFWEFASGPFHPSSTVRASWIDSITGCE